MVLMRKKARRAKIELNSVSWNNVCREFVREIKKMFVQRLMRAVCNVGQFDNRNRRTIETAYCDQ